MLAQFEFDRAGVDPLVNRPGNLHDELQQINIRRLFSAVGEFDGHGAVAVVLGVHGQVEWPGPEFGGVFYFALPLTIM